MTRVALTCVLLSLLLLSLLQLCEATCVVDETPLVSSSGEKCLIVPNASGNGTSAEITDARFAPCEDFYHYVNGKWLAETPLTHGRYFGYADEQNAALLARAENLVAAASAASGTEQEGADVLALVPKELVAAYRACTSSADHFEEHRKRAQHALDKLALQLRNTCTFLDKDGVQRMDVLCASALWQREGLRAVLRVDVLRSLREAGEHVLYLEPDSGFWEEAEEEQVARASLVSRTLLTSERHTVQHVLELEDALQVALNDAEQEYSAVQDLVSYVHDQTSRGLKAHTLQRPHQIESGSDTARLRWGRFYVQLSTDLGGSEQSAAVYEGLMNAHVWVPSLRYLKHLGALQARFDAETWFNYFCYLSRLQTRAFLRFLPSSASVRSDQATSSWQTQIGVHDSGFWLPWHEARLPAWHRVAHTLASAHHPEQDTHETCVAHLHAHMPEAMDLLFSTLMFRGTDTRARVSELVHRILEARQRMLMQNPHLSAAGKQALVEKLQAIRVRVGYPDQAREKLERYHRAPLSAHVSHLENMLEVRRRRLSARLQELAQGQESEEERANEWFEMRAHIVNAYYDPLSNTISVLSGILAAPFFHVRQNAATRFATLGTIVGHEIGHSTDASGIHFDRHGLVREWLPTTDLRVFEQSNLCFMRQYEAWIAEARMMESGARTVGEDAADNVGLHTALMALRDTATDGSALSDPELYNFFAVFGQMWAVRQSQAHLQAQLSGDPHPVARMRVNNGVLNSPEFGRLYQCKERTRACPSV